MKTYKAYRSVGLSRRAAIRGQIHTYKLAVWYAPSEFRDWWFWKITMPRMKRKDPAEYRAALDRMEEVLQSIA